MKNHGFAFVLSPLKVEADLPFTIAPGHCLDRATQAQIAKIKPALQTFLSLPIPGSMFSSYEEDIKKVPSDKPGSFSYRHTPLDENDWRYFVVAFQGNNSELGTIQQACLVIKNDIRLGFYFLESESIGSCYGWHSQAIHTFPNDSGLDGQIAKQISASDLELVSKTYTALKELPDDFEHTLRAFKRFNDLCNVSQYSELTVIGLFSVIESLLTHAPRLSESADSLTHQIRSKVPLVRKRFVRPLDHESEFDQIGEDKLWSKLYAYRSRIVHGEHATFDGELKALRDMKAVVDFLRETTKLLLIASLDEPVLMTDLKKC